MNTKYRNSMYHYDVLNQSVSNDLDKPKLENVAPENEHKHSNYENNKWGYGQFTPKCLQSCVSLPAFTAVYFLTSVQFGLFFVYVLNTLTTLEKHFHFKSKSSGVIVSSYEIGYILFILPITIYAGQRHRPRFIGFGIFGIMLASILYSFPYFIYGPPHIKHLTQGNASNSSHNFCMIGINQTNESPIIDCLNDQVSDSQGSNYGALGIFVFSIMIYGLSSAAVTSLGFPFMDDNAPKGESGFYLGIIMFSRLLGPIMGFFLGALTTSLYVDLSDPGFDSYSIHWIGAWWLGFLVIAITMPISGVLMLAFPRKLNKTKLDSSSSIEKKLMDSGIKEKLPGPTKKIPKIKMKEVPRVIANLMKNPVLISRILGDTCSVLGFMGFISFMNKYIETKFQIATHQTNLLSGPVFMFGFACGIVLGSCLFKAKLVNLRQLTLMILFGSTLWMSGLIVLMHIDCPPIILNNNWNTNSLNMSDSCNIDTCLCDNQKFAPVCDLTTMVSYFSPCHAGCTDFNSVNKSFVNCFCASENSTIIDGLCKSPCKSVYIYLGVMFIVIFISTIPAIGNTLVTLRCVPANLKSIALGLEMMIVGILGIIPSPILYGSQADASCAIWENSGCGQEGACKMYNGEEFRIRFHAIGASLFGLAIIPNFICWFKSRNWKFSDDEEDEVVNEEIIYEKIKKETEV